MKRFTTSIMFMQIVLWSSCRNYGNEQTLDTAAFNDSIQRAAVSKEGWSRTPELIAKHLFPTRVRGAGNRSYAVQIDAQSNTACTVIVVDEGAMENGDSGQRWNARFKRKENSWQLTRLTRASR